MKKYILIATTFATSLTFANSQKDLSFSGSCESSNRATISFVGDILVHKAIYKSVAKGSKDFSTIWNAVNPMIQKADFSVANLEGAAALGIDSNGRDKGDVGFIYDGKVYSGTNFVFNYHPKIAKDLKKSGYDLISFANNHSMDRFSLGVDKTLEALHEADLITSGARKTYEDESKLYSVVNIEGINVAFVACTESLNGRSDKENQILNCNNGSVEKIVKKLKESSEVDFITVMPHWGIEYKTEPSGSQKMLARKFAEAGAGAVIGSHPHVPQPWEKYITSKGEEALFVYSLGNFVAFQKGLNNKTGPIVYLNLVKDLDNKAKISGVAYSLTQRQGYYVLPVGKNAKSFVNNGKKFYGAKSFLLPEEPLAKILCD
ncbi:bacterial capsule synthesis protein [Bacteriovorax sp. BSW11_IV]|uniref:CapA family protein n=1 Tax=Bacteriovorax sp. BSW11_IV TaxID=1353529 RepID=UPI00038A215B|nr:CapA family protein [Bacteriovorax sp. BSW11_IV]EQC48256.1 bacterial capsule synthesis protein [Bacteriovorax sp. BSW11_IV]